MVAIAVAAAMTGSQALAADVSLTAGKPAGVKSAQAMNNGGPSLWLIGLGAAVVIAAVVVATQSDNNAACGAACSTPVTTSTSG